MWQNLLRTAMAQKSCLANDDDDCYYLGIHLGVLRKSARNMNQQSV
jgi:hypothetical protein